jgi:predicted MPP superfamily phosphohydrolase
MVQLFNRRQLLVGAGALALAGIAHAGTPRRETFQVTEHELPLPGLDPAHDGVRVAHLTDLHIGLSTPDGRITAAVRAINEARPDLVLLTGDFVTASRRPLTRVGRLLAGLLPPTLAVLGNHDHWVDAAAVRRDLEANGYAVLQNTWTSLRIHGAPLAVVGVDDGRTGRDDVPRALAGLPAEGGRLVMMHTPPTALKLPAGAGLACFAGHTHGGQLQIPRLTDALVRRAGQPFVKGWYRVAGNPLYVNCGLGYGLGGPAVRLNAPPEVAFFTLRAAPPATDRG